MVAPTDFEQVVDAHQRFLRKQGRDPDTASNEILKFLALSEEDVVAIKSTPQVILIAPSFSKEITTTVLWLNDKGLNIKCLQARPYDLQGKLYLDIEQLIPLQSANEYQTSLSKKAQNAERQATAKRREHTIAALVSSGILKPNMRLVLIRSIRPGLTIDDDKAKHATFLGEDGVQWDFDKETYSLSGLCRRICEEYGGEVGSGAFAGPDFWALDGETVPLSQMAKDLPKA